MLPDFRKIRKISLPVLILFGPNQAEDDALISHFVRMKWALALVGTLGLLLPVSALPVSAWAQQQVGPVSGLPLPRYVSLKSDRVNLREGPSKDHRTTWVYQRAGLPMEITAEFETWRKVRDSEGSEGWVLHSLLSGRRTALVAPWKKNETFTLYVKPNDRADPVARLQPGVIGSVKTCKSSWCRLIGEGFDGYIQQSNLWGVYPDERID
jgi:SH3-like domain-containing protein